MILVYPNKKVLTPLIYQKFDKFSGLTTPQADVKILVSELSKKGSQAAAHCFFNSLEAVTSRLYPVVNQVKKSLFDMGLEKVIMSGSGPTVFAVCSSQKQARNLSDKLHKKYRSWQIFAVTTV